MNRGIHKSLLQSQSICRVFFSSLTLIANLIWNQTNAAGEQGVEHGSIFGETDEHLKQLALD